MTHPVDSHVGSRIRQARLMRGKTQTELADALGISFQQVQKYELGRNRISASKLFETAKCLQLDVAFFFNGLETSNNAAPLMSASCAEAANILAQLPAGTRQNILAIIRLAAAVTPETKSVAAE